jgi:hypothetical protein
VRIPLAGLSASEAVGIKVWKSERGFAGAKLGKLAKSLATSTRARPFDSGLDFKGRAAWNPL